MTENTFAAKLLHRGAWGNPLRLPGLTASIAVLLAFIGNAAEMPNTNHAEIVRSGVKSGAIAFKLTTPEELQELLGKPQRQEQGKDGGMVTLTLVFPEVVARFSRSGEFGGGFLLYSVEAAGRGIDIGEGRPIVLRSKADLKNVDPFWGLAGVSLAKLDLGDQLKTLEKFSFDSLTVWPGPEQLPKDFIPQRILDEGKNPGLGTRQLHARGIDGRGVGLAIIDQPLLCEHEDYQERIVKYEGIDVEGIPPQMHGPSVASIAVGKSCGVAPGAALYYFAVPMWKWQQNEPWAEQLERIMELNSRLKDTPKIRVVSISLGAFSERRNYARWKEALQKAEAAGILVVTCDPDWLRLATLKRIENRLETNPGDYAPGWITPPGAALWVPAGNRTTASFRGPEVYTYYRLGGLSWTVPYLAGMAALGLQIDPELKPGEIVRLWRETASKAAVGPVVSPGAFVEAVRQRLAKSK